ALGDPDFGFLFALRRVTLLVLKESLVRIVQFVQNALQRMYRSILQEVAVRVWIVASQLELIHHFVRAQLLFLASAVAGLLQREVPIPDEPLAAGILAHQTLLCTRGLQPVVGESL